MIELSKSASALSLRLRGLEEGGLGGRGLFNLAGEGFESEAAATAMRLGSEGGSFSLEGLCLRGLDLVELGDEEQGSSAEEASLSIAFFGSMKCFIVAGRSRERGG